MRRSRMVRPIALVLGAIFALSGCVPSTTEDGGKTPEPTPTPTASTAPATWQGLWQSTKYEISGTFTLLVVIADGEMNGTIDIADSPCVSSGTIAGVADAGSVTFGTVEAGNEVEFEGTISADGTSMEGTYTDGEACGNDVGSWSALQSTG